MAEAGERASAQAPAEQWNAHAQVGDRLCAGVASIENFDLRVHAPQNLQKAGARRIHTDVANQQPFFGRRQNTRHNEKSRRRKATPRP